MDIELLNQVKSTTGRIREIYDEICGESCKEDVIKESALVYEVINKNIEGLYKVKENIILRENDEYEACSDALKPLIRNLLKLSARFIRQQDLNILLTQQRLKNKDSHAYLKEGQFRNNIIFACEKNTENENDKIIDNRIDEFIDKIIGDTQKRYTDAFGGFKDREEANKIIRKEYNDSSKYMELFFRMKETIYENFDNYDVLISGLQNISYELIQLNTVLRRAIQMKQKSTGRDRRESDNLGNVYFVIMDGVQSTSANMIEKLSADTEKLNIEIAGNHKVKLLCKFKMYKQDEIQGFIVGDIEEFLRIVDRVYESKLKIAYSAKPFSEIKNHIKNIQDTVYDVPFDIYGDICKEARRKMEQKSYAVSGNRADNKNG